MKIYIAGKVRADSVFGTHHWRGEFCARLSELSGVALDNLDPVKTEQGLTGPHDIFAKDVRLISQADVLLVYLTDDISVGGSQEILIARYLRKPVIGFAPLGGKFNGSSREMFGTVIDNYQDPFVFSTCDVVCGTLEETAEALKTVGDITSSGLDIIDNAIGGQI